MTANPGRRNWFDGGGHNYARFRPTYPPELANVLALRAPQHRLAVDVGCGSGQLTLQLADHFSEVLGLDPSADQIASAPAAPKVSYHCAPAERLPVADRCADMVTAAQAAHWFDLPRFYDEVRRVAAADAVLALISYGVLRLDHDLDDRFQRFYRHEIGPYWPPERQQVDNGYADMPFPFREQAAPTMTIDKDWDLHELLGYISTWSAVKSVQAAGQQQLLTQFADDLAGLWGPAGQRRRVSWPIHMRVGRV